MKTPASQPCPFCDTEILGGAYAIGSHLVYLHPKEMKVHRRDPVMYCQSFGCQCGHHFLVNLDGFLAFAIHCDQHGGLVPHLLACHLGG